MRWRWGEKTGCLLRLLPIFLLGLIAAVVAVWVWRHESWYLAIDQFGYLTFARDLAEGRVFHDWEPARFISHGVARGQKIDVLAQTYVLADGRLYCRYAPGFPLLLAAALRLGGEIGVHLVNPLAMAGLVLVLGALGTRLFRSAWSGLVTAILLVLLPNYLLLWSISPLRDVPAHAIALLGLFLLLPLPETTPRRLGVLRTVGAGLLLGYAVSIRPDAVFYGVPAALLALSWRPRQLAPLLAGALACVLGASPLLAYNALVTGNPFRPTQAMEIEEILSRFSGSLLPLSDALSPSPAVAAASDVAVARGATSEAAEAERQKVLVQGGGLKLAHLDAILPANLNLIAAVLGPFLVVLLLLGAVAALLRPSLALLVLPYLALTIPFFSLWSRPDIRYLAGSLILLPLLIVEGGRTLTELPSRLSFKFGRVGCFATAALVVGLVGWMAFFESPGAGARQLVAWTVAAAVAASTLLGAWRHERGGWAFSLLCGLGLTVVFADRTVEGIETRGSFQQAQVERARTTVGKLLPANALVLTSTRIGRPLENLEHYAGISTIYLEEAQRWGVSPGRFARNIIDHEMRPFLLLRAADARDWLSSRQVLPFFEGRIVAEIPASRARDVFVASRQSAGGVPLVLVEVLRRPKPLID